VLRTGACGRCSGWMSRKSDVRTATRGRLEPTLFRDPLASTGRVPVDNRSSPETKVALFRSLFAGRGDVYAARWENERSGKSGWSPIVVGRSSQRSAARS